MNVLSQFDDKTPVFLAPMSGGTDAPFRRQATKFGAKFVVSEMIAGSELATGRPDMVRRLANHEGEGPFIIQLAGREARWVKEGAEIAAAAGADIIDLNMGCPSKQVTGGRSGAALMRDLDLAKALIDAALEASDVPVSVKMRLGWDANSLNAPQLASIAEAAGASYVTVHGRTRDQFYDGSADWERIGDTVKAVGLPVIANGDITEAASARACLSASGAHGVMVGRAAMGRPWRVAEIDAHLNGNPWVNPEPARQIEALIEQVEDSCSLYGEMLGVRIVRKHVAAFIDQAEWLANESELRRIRVDLCQKERGRALIEALMGLLAQRVEEAAA